MNISGKLDTAANAAMIIAALLLSVVLIKVYLLPSTPQRPIQGTPAIAAGTSMKERMDGVDWQRNGRTLVLALSTQCHFCTASAPFFRMLVAQAGKNVKMVAVFPQPVDEAQKYLTGEGVKVDQIKQLSLNRIGVTGTPTMLVINNLGVVTNVWVGELQPDQQGKVLSVLNGAPATTIFPVIRPFGAQP